MGNKDLKDISLFEVTVDLEQIKTALESEDAELHESKLNSLNVFHVPIPQDVNSLFKILNKKRISYFKRATDYVEEDDPTATIKSGVYIAVKDISDTKDPELVKYNFQRVFFRVGLTPVWLRLIFRKNTIFKESKLGCDIRGQCVLEAKENKGFIDAYKFDCTSRKTKKDPHILEVTMGYSRLCLLECEYGERTRAKEYWRKGRDKHLYQVEESQLKVGDTVYRKISSDGISTLDFMNFTNAAKFKESRIYVINLVRNGFIETASQYGLMLKPFNLTFEEVGGDQSASSLKGSKPLSIAIDREIQVIDLRVSKALDACELLSKALLMRKGVLEIDFIDSGVNEANIAQFAPVKGKSYLVVIDQRRGVTDDRYPLARHLVQQTAIQRININPFDVLDISVKGGHGFEGVLLSRKDSFEVVDEAYLNSFAYLAESPEKDDGLLNVDNYLQALSMKIVPSLLSLTKKSVVLGEPVSKRLPQNTNILNEDVLCFYDGVFITVKDDALHMGVVDLRNKESREQCDEVLKRFDLSMDKLLRVFVSKYPYLEELRLDSNSKAVPDYRKNILSRVILLFRKTDKGVDILFQDDKGQQRLIPNELSEAFEWVRGLDVKRLPGFFAVRSEDEFYACSDTVKEKFGITDSKIQSLRKKHSELVNKSNAFISTHSEPCLYKEFLKAMALSTHDSKVFSCFMSEHTGTILLNPKNWIKDNNPFQRICADKNKNYLIIGEIGDLQSRAMKQPSVRKFHTLHGSTHIDFDWLVQLFDVDWVRMGNYSGNLCFGTLVGEWKDIHNYKDMVALGNS